MLIKGHLRETVFKLSRNLFREISESKKCNLVKEILAEMMYFHCRAPEKDLLPRAENAMN